MDTIKAILHGTTKEEEKAKRTQEPEYHDALEGDNSHQGISSPTEPKINPVPEGVSPEAGGLGSNTMKTDYNATPADDTPLTTHGRHEERERTLGEGGGVDMPVRPRDPDVGDGSAGSAGVGTGMGGVIGGTSGAGMEHSGSGSGNALAGVGNGSNITGPNTAVHGIDSNAGLHSQAGDASQSGRDPLGGNAPNTNTSSGLGAVTGIPSGNVMDDPTHRHGTTGLGSSSHSGTATGFSGDQHNRDLSANDHGLSGSGSNTHSGTNTGVSGEHGREAALGSAGLGSAALGTAAVAHHEHGHGHEQGHGHHTDNTGLSSNNPYGSSTAASTAEVREGATSDHHGGRDTAALGTAGVVGEGIHHSHHDSHSHQQSGHEHAHGPHSTETANRLDPNLGGGGHVEGAHKHHGHAQPGRNIEGGGAEEADGVHGAKGTSADPRILGKDEFDARHGTGQGHTGTSSLTGIGSTGTSAHTGAGNTSTHSTSEGHHYGRDAALAGGAGGAAYEASKHSGSHGHEQNAAMTSTHGDHQNAPKTTGPHKSSLLNKLDPRVHSDSSKSKGHEKGQTHDHGHDAGIGGSHAAATHDARHHNQQNDPTTSNTHHVGRDAAIAGGLGGAGYEAQKHHSQHDNTGTTTTGHQTSAHSHQTDPTHSHGQNDTHGIMDRSRPHVDSNDNLSGQNQSHIADQSHTHHQGRDATLASGAGGAAYAAHQHSGHENPTQNYDQHHTTGQTPHDTQTQGHTGHTPLNQIPVGQDLGDKLHGSERNRGVVGETGFPHDHKDTSASYSSPHTNTGTETGNLAHERNPAIGQGVPGAPRGNMSKGEHQGPPRTPEKGRTTEHLFTSPVLHDNNTNANSQSHSVGSNYPPTSGATSGAHGTTGHEHGNTGSNVASQGDELKRRINEAPLGNTGNTPGSGLMDRTDGMAGTHGVGREGVAHGEGLSGNSEMANAGTSGESKYV